jgi:hypothetical protein
LQNVLDFLEGVMYIVSMEATHMKIKDSMKPYKMEVEFIKPVKFGLKNVVGMKSPVNGGK